MATELYPRFHHELFSNERKTREAILYVCSKTNFGQVRLNKTLWHADFEAFRRRGWAITGQEYQHLRLGPALRRMMPILRELREAGEITFEDVPEFQEQHPAPTHAWHRQHLSEDDLAYLDEAIDLIGRMSAKEATDWAHDFPGWRDTEQGDTIDYEWVFWSDDPPTEEEIAYGLSLESSV